MKNEYVKFYATESAAINRCEDRNRAARRAGNRSDTVAVVDGPDNNWAVVDLRTAIELGNGYRIFG